MKATKSLRRHRKAAQQVAISEFKAKCLSLLDQVNRTKAPLRVTRRGEPIADVVPASPAPAKEDWLGSMSSTIEIEGDIVAPVIEIPEIEAARN